MRWGSGPFPQQRWPMAPQSWQVPTRPKPTSRQPRPARQLVIPPLVQQGCPAPPQAWQLIAPAAVAQVVGGPVQAGGAAAPQGRRALPPAGWPGTGDLVPDVLMAIASVSKSRMKWKLPPRVAGAS